MAVKDKLVAVVKNPAVRKTAVAFVMAILAALGISLGTGCASLTPAQERALQKHRCYVAALKPALGDLSQDVLRAALAGGDLVGILKSHDLEPSEVFDTIQRVKACASTLDAGADSGS
jgi:hypothetical protein